jgi:Tol biopolymer transport system component
VDIDKRVRVEARRRWGVAGTVAAVFAAAIIAAAPVADARVAQPRIDTPAAVAVEAQVDDASHPSISADGRWIVFGGVAEGRRTVFRTDRDTAITSEMSPVPANVRAGDTIHARLSADGCVVVAVTEIAFDLFRDDDRRGRWDVYRLVVPECGGQPNAWELVSMDRTGAALDGVLTDSAPSLSGSGAVVAFVEQLRGAPDGVGTIRVVDVTVPPQEAGREQTVAGMPVEAPNRAYIYRGAREPSLSQNGRHLAFVSDTTASAALPGWASGRVPGREATPQVYVWDRGAADQRRSVQLISGVNGSSTLLGAHSPAISADGRVVAFVSPDRTLVPAALPRCSITCSTQVYRFDRDTDRNGIFDEPARRAPLTIVSAVDAGTVTIGVPVAGDGSSWAPALNADGTQVAFVTDATNLLPSRRGGGGRADDGDLLVAEVQLGALRRVLDGADATGLPGAHGNPSLSRTGQVIAFDTAATDALMGSSIGTGRRSIATVVVTPRLALAEVDFGSVLPFVDSTELYVQVQNAGPAAFEPTVFDTTSNFRVTGGTCAKGILVAAGSTCSVNLTFRPTAVRGYTGSLTVSGPGPAAPSVTTTLRGAAGEPALLADPGGVDLAPGVVGGAGGRVAIDIDNFSFAPVEISRITVGGANPGDFRIATESCTGGRSLNPDASCAIEVEFHPIDDGYRSALIIATTSTGVYTAAIVGGFASYAPTFVVERGSVAPGGDLDVTLAGFPAGSAVSIGFDDGGDPFALVSVDDSGGSSTRVTIPLRVRSGVHRLVASAGDTSTATTIIAITATRRPITPGVPGYGLG